MVESDDRREGEGRLQRWSRLKREAKAEKTKKTELHPAPSEAKMAALTPAAPTAHSVPATRPEPGKSEEQKKIDDVIKDLPSLESLGKDSDYSLFMREGVPEDMRTAALRKLWQSDASFTEPFPFELHMEDYNKTFTPINAATDTIFRAGLGYLFDDDNDKTKNIPGAEIANQSAPGGTETGGELASESAKFLPAAKEEIAPTNSAEALGQAEAPEGEKFSSRKS